MFLNNLLIAWRTLLKNKIASIINIAGLATGMAVAVLIGLWIYDELTFDHYHPDHSRIAQVMQNQTFSDVIRTGNAVCLPLAAELRKSYSKDFKHIIIASWSFNHTLSNGTLNMPRSGNFMEAGITDMLALHMLSGTRNGLQDPHSIMLSQDAAKALFGSEEAVGRSIKIDNNFLVTVTGVYEKLPANTSFHDLDFIAPWPLWATQDFVKRNLDQWGNNSYQLFVQIADNADMNKVSAAIRDVKLKATESTFHPQLFLFGMDRWHLYSEYKNGVNTGGLIRFVWLFGCIGSFVLLLACINFMNLSTARSEKRFKEIGIRKAVGSLRSQLIIQFYGESILMVFFALAVALLLLALTLPAFNAVAGKQISIPWAHPLFWVSLLTGSFVTGLISGSYPALYLSSFQPVKILKGAFKTGRTAALPRRVLVVTQFTVSVILITGTIIVFRQIEYAKSRPSGYDSSGLISVELSSTGLEQHINNFRNDVLKASAAVAVATSGSPLTGLHSNTSSITWSGKDPAMTTDIGTVNVSFGFGQTTGWQLKEGRDFSPQMGNDSSAVILNEAAARYMGLTHPVGQIIYWGDQPLTVIGVVNNLLMESPYAQVKQTVFYMDSKEAPYLHIRLNPNIPVKEALEKTEAAFKQNIPGIPFRFEFADTSFASKFDSEERIGTLSGFFAFLAIFISCLGLFGMAAFVTEQRTKEIGIRKTLGASVVNLWSLLSKDYLVLVIIAFFIATPVAWIIMHRWLNNYEYHTQLQWWVFALAGTGALLVTLLTVSYQSIKAALTNPVKSLKSE